MLNLRADRGVQLDEELRVQGWNDASPAAHHAAQENSSARPKLIAEAVNGQPALRFDGKSAFLHLTGELLTSQQYTIFAVVNDQGSNGHREILSNWDGAGGNAGSSVFLGATGPSAVRFSDNFAPAGELSQQTEHFLLTAVAEEHDAILLQNGAELARKGSALAARKLNFPYVIGRQGNLNGEYWQGDIAEILVFDRALGDEERSSVEQYLRERYGLQGKPEVPPDPELLALASLCHVLLNSNEFLYVD